MTEMTIRLKKGEAEYSAEVQAAKVLIPTYCHPFLTISKLKFSAMLKLMSPKSRL